jgi:hypothetical protein
MTIEEWVNSQPWVEMVADKKKAISKQDATPENIIAYAHVFKEYHSFLIAAALDKHLFENKP